MKRFGTLLIICCAFALLSSPTFACSPSKVNVTSAPAFDGTPVPLCLPGRPCPGGN
jgi:hypothetical protein